MKTHVISIRISTDIYDWIDALARKRGLPMSSLMFELLKEIKETKRGKGK